MATPKTLDYRQKIGKVVSSVSIADEKEKDVAFSAIDRMEPIDSNRYGFVPGKIAFNDVVNNAL